MIPYSTGRIHAIEVEVEDDLPLGLPQGSRSALIERYGPPWQPLPGQLRLARGPTSVLLTFAEDDARVERMRWTKGAGDIAWEASCEQGPITTDGPNTCTTSDGFQMEGEFQGGRLVDGRVQDPDQNTVAEIEAPPTPEELAVLEAERVAKQTKDAENHAAWLARRIRAPEASAMWASELAGKLLLDRDTATYLRQAESALRGAGYALDDLGNCPEAKPGIEAARALLLAASEADLSTPLVASVALADFGERFQRVWAAPAAALATCYGVPLPPPVPLPERAGGTDRVVAGEGQTATVLSDGVKVAVKVPPGWACESADHACTGALGRVFFQHWPQPSPLEAAVAYSRGTRRCTRPQADGVLTFLCQEGANSSRNERSYLAMFPADRGVVSATVWVDGWNDAMEAGILELLRATRVDGEVPSVPPYIANSAFLPVTLPKPPSSHDGTDHVVGEMYRAIVYYYVGDFRSCSVISTVVPEGQSPDAVMGAYLAREGVGGLPVRQMGSTARGAYAVITDFELWPPTRSGSPVCR